MGENSDKNFPYKINILSPEENDKLNRFGGSNLMDYIRIGPKGYLLPVDYANEAAKIYNFPTTSEDIFVASYPKSGTTWTQELVWLLENNLDYEKAKSVSLSERFPFLEISTFPFLAKIDIKLDDDQKERDKVVNVLAPLKVEQIKELPSPKFIKTHLPMSLLPATILDNTKVVYVARDPRDVAVSFYHHQRLMRVNAPDVEFKPFWNYFVESKLLWTPFFDHLLEAWEQRNHPNMLFLFYEELSKDFSAAIRRVATFLNKTLSDDEIAGLQEHLKIDNFKKNKSVNFENLQKNGIFRTDESFVRKGKVGGWREYFDEEMMEQAEKWIADSMRDTDLRFFHF